MTTRGLFITGTDTGVGKTYVTAMIARQLVAEGWRVGAYKPVCSGSILGPDGEAVFSDVDELSMAIGGRFEQERICAQRFAAPLAPPVAARMEGKSVNETLLYSGADWWNLRVDFLLIEGVGGLLCPLSERISVADFAGEVGFPLIVVSRLGLGTINHTLMTVEIARNRGLTVAGIVFNRVSAGQVGPEAETSPAEIATRCDLPVLGVLEYNQPDGLRHNHRRIRIDWSALAAGMLEQHRA